MLFRFAMSPKWCDSLFKHILIIHEDGSKSNKEGQQRQKYDRGCLRTKAENSIAQKAGIGTLKTEIEYMKVIIMVLESI